MASTARLSCKAFVHRLNEHFCPNCFCKSTDAASQRHRRLDPHKKMTQQLTHHKTQMNVVNLVCFLAASLLVLSPIYANEKRAKCIIRGADGSSTPQYSGSCLFDQVEKGSFIIRKSDGEILPSITDVSVYVLSPGVAEVRGLTIHGVNSRWGPANRSQQDPACWIGSDFEVCAY